MDPLWTRVAVEPLSAKELSIVLAARFPPVAPAASLFVASYEAVCKTRRGSFSPSSSISAVISDDEKDSYVPIAALSRPVSVRDAVKWAGRVAASRGNVPVSAGPGAPIAGPVSEYIV